MESSLGEFNRWDKLEKELENWKLLKEDDPQRKGIQRDKKIIWKEVKKNEG